jgi:hypothetical protein
MPQYLKVIMAVAAIFALTAMGAFGVEAFLLAREVRAANRAAIGEVAVIAQEIKSRKIIADLSTLVRTANGVLNVTRDIERDNRRDIAAANAQTLATLQHVDGLVVSLDASQEEAAGAIVATAEAIQQDSDALAPVLQQTQADLHALEPAIEQVAPLLRAGTDVAVNLSQATADVQHEIHQFVYPPPRKWWQRYFTDPAKVAAHLLTIPISHI